MPCKKMNIVAPKIDPGGESMGGIRRLAMVSLRAGFSPFFLCLRASRSVLAPPAKLRPRLWAGRTVELLPKLRPAAGCPQRTG